MAETYSIRGHGSMIEDTVRMDAYAAALARTVRPGSVVLDIGTGTGMMALLACRLGARRVFAVDPGDSIHLARAAARASGFADRIHFIQDVSTRVELPERADVVVSDLRGVLPLFEQHVASIADARERLLAPGGVLVGRRDTLYAAPVEAEDEHRRITRPWDAHARGFDLSVARRAALNTWSKVRVPPDRLEVLLANVDGILLGGSDTNVDPRLWGEAVSYVSGHAWVVPKRERTPEQRSAISRFFRFVAEHPEKLQAVMRKRGFSWSWTRSWTWTAPSTGSTSTATCSA